VRASEDDGEGRRQADGQLPREDPVAADRGHLLKDPGTDVMI
jgi:hypothetical protein